MCRENRRWFRIGFFKSEKSSRENFFLDMRGKSDRILLAKKGSHENKRRLYGKSTANAERFCEGS